MAALPTLPMSKSDPRYRPRVRETKFADGYVLRVKDGLNHLEEERALEWQYLSQANRDTLINFFTARGGYESFTWQPPGAAAALNWVCKRWGVRRSRGGPLYTVTATLTRDFA